LVAISGDPILPKNVRHLLKVVEEVAYRGYSFWLSRSPQTSINGAQSGTVLGAATAITLHSLWVIPQLAQRYRIRSPIVRGDHGSKSIDDSFKKPLQTGHGRLS
jgi:hypothetical protein